MNGIEYINIDVINVVNEQIIFLQSTMPWEVKKINKYWLKCFKLVLRYWETTPYHNAFCQVVKIEVILEQFKKKIGTAAQLFGIWQFWLLRHHIQSSKAASVVIDFSYVFFHISFEKSGGVGILWRTTTIW